MMSRTILVLTTALLGLGFVNRQAKPYRVAFDLTSRDTLDQRAVLRWIKETTGANPEAEVEVVMYGRGFELVMPERSRYTADVQAAMTNPRVSFQVCAIALKNNQIERSQLQPGIQTVPDGIRELVSKQQEGWGYIKVSH
jgi:intracellular sulfur oxidation DsrE/DsrF family protein